MTPNKEDYLKCIYEIGTHTQKITNKEIAAQMQVSPPAVTEMIKKMTAEKLIVKDKTNGYLLTDLGLHLVSELYRKHRLIEAFLVHDLGYTTKYVARIAHTFGGCGLSYKAPCTKGLARLRIFSRFYLTTLLL